MVKMAPRVGPFRSPPTASTYAVPMAPVRPMLSRPGPMPAWATKSLGERPDWRWIQASLCQACAVEPPATEAHRSEQQRQHAAQQPVVAGGPDEHRVGHETVGLVHRHGERAQDACDPADVVQRVAHVRVEQVRRAGHQHEAQQQRGGHRQRQADVQRQGRAEQDLGEDRRQRGAEEGHVDVLGEGLALVARVGDTPATMNQTLSRFLPNRREAQHQEQAGHRRAADDRARAPVEGQRRQRQQPGIDEGRADAAQADVVGDERVARAQDGDQAVPHLLRRVDGQAEGDEGQREQRHDGQQLVPRAGHGLNGVAGRWGRSWSSRIREHAVQCHPLAGPRLGVTTGHRQSQQSAAAAAGTAMRSARRAPSARGCPAGRRPRSSPPARRP